jgi:Holliday junction resolvase RusA-like endonuclease
VTAPALLGLSPVVDEVLVVGLPAPQGSKRHVGHGVMVESSKNAGPWREAVASQMVAALGPAWEPLTTPVYLGVEFRLPRPRSRKRERYVPTSPDLDKLIRSTCDGMTIAGVWKDDALVVEVHATKTYVDDVTPYTCARISVALVRP